MTLMKAGRAVRVAYSGSFHIAFLVESEATVDEIHRRLKEHGFDVAAPQRHHAYGFYVQAPGGFSVELGV